MKKKAMLAIIIALIMLTSTVSALALTGYTNWGPRIWTPYQGNASISSTYIRCALMKWNQASKTAYGIDDYWEFELRDDNIHSIYNGFTGSISNLPYFYEELNTTGSDNDDISFGVWHIKGITVEKSYYGQLDYGNNTGYYNYISHLLTFESEKGIWGIFDGLPTHYEQDTNSLRVYVATSKGW
ncbi:hypothetical protein FACS1894202_09270 [Clostridia bacterium]|nr:hypothetical protein FACS1894202_09270 [Clostridia bacterium]